MSLIRLIPEQEAEAKHLEAKISIAIAKEVADLARLLVSKGDNDLFGARSFRCAIGLAHGCQNLSSEHLREKKTAMANPPSIVPAAAKEPGSRIFVRSNP